VKKQEAVNIIVDETNESSINDVSFSLNTASSGTAEIVTESINGELLAVILKSDKKVWIRISLVDSDITVFEKEDYAGNFYMPLKISPLSKSGQVFNFSADKWFLNDRLRINIKGDFNSVLSGVVRWR